MGLVFIVLAIISIGNNSVVLIKLTAEMRECSNISKKKSNRARNKRSDNQTSFKETPGLAKFSWKRKHDDELVDFLVQL